MLCGLRVGPVRGGLPVHRVRERRALRAVGVAGSVRRAAVRRLTVPCPCRSRSTLRRHPRPAVTAHSSPCPYRCYRR